ncbi:MAG TPA: MotA/TolQ/ExbB proton channel family protein [Cyclobacteriaceae bacterium]|nr:MotA/TolQ/ExbB proton channel family protein [Cyclobacteriaceae bacterium]HMV10253.1 MotA/TolQ/ExbB proton channel family protein [Cyclobacteriaceae bacterium]HMV89514.1 MotA/TolQ/ExbB proton channel family protein [Cyclobacteriaceae bacterium]HMW99733.1 MotA/TolQ/ExbB proton channel family protein [Cyclobacteriaceae bacterium]HMX50125.1 MotA/TolQ/ExbB proton channel family protein [Cyclobacteriaceae bacterium]
MKNSNSGLFAAIIIVVEVTIAILFYKFVLGNPDNFVGGDPANHPLQGNYFGIVYKGGFIVPILIAMLMIVITFSIERLITIGRAKGRGNVKTFVQKIKHLIASNNITQAIAECDKQKGSVANVVKAGLVKYNDLAKNSSIEPDKKVVLIQKDIEETTQLEMPMLEKNLVILATIVSIATLLGLLGTVMGMIKAFAALATAGAPDSVGLANGISEALINTALGIGTSALAIIFYNYFTSAIDGLTHAIDETSFSIIQNFTAQNKAA